MMDRSAAIGIVKIVMVFTIISLLSLNIIPLSNNVDGFQTNPNTEIYIRVHNWNSVSVNNSEYTNVITDFPIEDVRAQMDGFGNKDGLVDEIEVRIWSEGLENKLNQDFEQNQDQDIYIFQMLIDHDYGTFNRTRVYFEDMEGAATSTSPAMFSIEILLDYTKTNINSNSHQIQLNIGEIFPESQAFFKTVKMKMPDNWAFNTSLLKEDFPRLTFEDDTLLNVTFNSYSDNPDLSEWFKVDGLWVEKIDTTPNGGNGNGNGHEENGDSDNDEFFLSNMQLILLTAVIIIIVIAVVVVTSKKKED